MTLKEVFESLDLTGYALFCSLTFFSSYYLDNWVLEIFICLCVGTFSN